MRATRALIPTIFVATMVFGGCAEDSGTSLYKIYFDTHETTLTVGQTLQMGILYYPYDANRGIPDEPVIWTSDNESAIAVDSAGLLTAVAVGEALITAQLGVFEAQTLMKVDSEVTIDDNLFFNFCLEQFDTNGDGILQGLEVSHIVGIDLTELAVHNKAISLDGIEGFEALQKLKISGLKIARMDLGKNLNLIDIDCSLAEIDTLDLTANDKLEMLDCHGCETLSALILGNYDTNGEMELNTINCFRCNLTSIDLSRCTKLEYIDCRQNQLGGILDLSNSPLIVQISCSGNNLTGIQLSPDFDVTQLKMFDADAGVTMTY